MRRRVEEEDEDIDDYDGAKYGKRCARALLRVLCRRAQPRLAHSSPAPQAAAIHSHLGVSRRSGAVFLVATAAAATATAVAAAAAAATAVVVFREQEYVGLE